MAFNNSLATRIRDIVAKKRNIVEKKMFGGIGFLLNGNMLVGVWKDSLIARIGPDLYDAALRDDFVVEFDITGRAMKGWVMIQPDGIDTDAQLSHWIQASLKFVETLPPKESTQPPAKK
jgi:TfoX/Sxy family transcriptional regulator of competence genes